MSIFAQNLGGPRVLIENELGTILTSIPSEGRVVALIDSDKDGKTEATYTVLDNLNRPHGLATKDGKLYVAQSDEVTSYDYDPSTQVASNKQTLANLPDGGSHFTRTLIFNGEELLVSVGSSCNVCLESDSRRAAILAINSDGSTRTFAHGLRNSVFMAIHPESGELWATEMGRDRLGDDLPPDEVNIIKEGGFYGWPYCYGRKTQDKDWNDSEEARNICNNSIPTSVNLQAHSAPLGLAFIYHEAWPVDWQGDLLVVYHGSWNRTVPTGYKIVKVNLRNQNEPLVEDFITGWFTSPSGGLSSPQALGRPVDILMSKGGIAYISDDKAGVVYALHPPGLDR
jgi:glucose/arabinose dehydrogenase